MPVSVQPASKTVKSCQTALNPPESWDQDDRNTTLGAESPHSEVKEELKGMEVHTFTEF